MDADESLGRWPLKKRTRLIIYGLADEIVRASVTDVEFDGFIEFDKFEQNSLTGDRVQADS